LTPAGPPADRKLFGGVFLIALATLLFEITLIRVLSFTIWYHFAYVVLSTALLGFGASGTLLSIRHSIGTGDMESTLARLALASGISAAAVLGFVSAFPLHPIDVFDSVGQALLLLAYQIAATVPFFFSGLAISVALRHAARRVDRLYFWDLLGAGIGCASAVALMNALTPPGAALLAAAVFAAAAVVFAPVRQLRARAGALAALLLVLAPFGGRIPFEPAPSKHLAMQLNGNWGEIGFEDWTALFRTDVLEMKNADAFTPRLEWGLSKSWKQVQKPWGFVHHDASAGTPIYDTRAGSLDFLDHHVLRMPYAIANPRPRVLVIGVGGGRDVIAAQRFGASHVTGVELDPVTVDLIQNRLSELDAGFFHGPQVDIVASEGRHFVKRSQERFDVIQITGVDTLAATAQGAYVLAENYLYTVEAFEDYLDHLTPGGLLSIATGHWDANNPRASARMVSVARRALLERGVEHPERHIAVITSNRLLAEVMVKNEPFSAEQIQTLSDLTAELDFRALLLGDDGHPVFRAVATADGAERRALFARLRYVIDSITDDSPFFFRFFRWGDLWNARELGPVHTTALGQLVLAALLISLSTLGGLFVLAPLFVFQRRGVVRGAPALGVLAYFLALGLGFMLFEISLLQRFVLYLGYPTYSLTVVLFSLLTSLGLGSYLSRRWVGHEKVALPAAVGVVALLALFYMHGLPWLQDATLGSPLAVRVACTVGVLAPLGLTLGSFFPLGIRRAELIHPDLVPWAWGINGCASVTATVLAVVLAMNIGFERVWLLSLAIYAAGVAALLLTSRRSPAAAG
jgi:spermidine synthase